MEEKISIVIPAYNIEDYLGTALDSVIAQTYCNLEIIVVNDGSKDGTAKIMNEYAEKDERIKVIHKENGGVTSARLRGIEAATGEYIGFVDGDDYIEPDMYGHLIENMKKYDADISHCGYQMVFPSHIDYYYNTGKLHCQDDKEGCKDLLEGRFIEPGLVNKLYRRELFNGLGEWMDTSIKINEDLLQNFYLFKQSKRSVFEDVCPYHYVLRKGSAATSKMSESKLKDPIKVMHRLLEETADVEEWYEIVKSRLLYQLMNTATMRLGDQKELIAPVRHNARRELRDRLPEMLKCKVIGKKYKVFAVWAAVWPWSYGFVHRMYQKMSGSDKKYEVK